MQIAVLGTGIMGAPMARRLAEGGHGVTAWNRTRERAEGLGVRVADTPADVVRDADVVLTMLADAGPEEVRPRCEEVFAAISRATLWVGDGAPAGQALKLVVNSWILNTVVNIGETVAFAEGLGLDPQQWLDAISGGGMDMQYAHLKTEALRSGNLEPAFKLALAHKDAGLVVEAAEDAGLNLALARTTREQMAEAIALGHGAEDMASV